MSRVLAISGSLRRSSYNSALLGVAAAECGPGVEFVFWTGLDTIPAYNEDLDETPPAVALLKAEIEQADAILFATPEYNASVPGALKNALDWVSRPFESNPLRDKPVGVISASEGVFGAAWAQAALRTILHRMGAHVEDRGLLVPQVQHAFTLEGRLRDPEQGATLSAILDALLEHACRRAA